MRDVEIKVQFQDIDAGFAEEAELAAFGVLLDEPYATATLCNGFFAGGVALKEQFLYGRTS